MTLCSNSVQKQRRCDFVPGPQLLDNTIEIKTDSANFADVVNEIIFVVDMMAKTDRSKNLFRL